MRKNVVKIASCVLAISLFASACGNKPSENSDKPTEPNESSSVESQNTEVSGKDTLELWDWWGDEQYKPVIEKLVEDFNKTQDSVEFVHVNYPWGDVWTKALANTAAGTPPDAIIQDIMSVTHRAEANQATNLQEYIDKEGEDFSKQFYPQLWEAMLYDGDAYGLPFVTDTRILYYDKDMFKEAGLDPEQPPKTWDELIDFARKLDVIEEDGTITRAGFVPHTLSWEIWAYIADGKELVDKEGNVSVNTPEKVQMFDKIYNDIIEHYGKDNILNFTGEFGQGAKNPFITGKVAMWANTPTESTKIRDFAPDKNYGVALMPELNAGTGHYSWGGGFSVEVPYGAKNVEASFALAKFLTSVDAQVYWAENVYDTVANMDAGSDKRLLENDVYAMAMEAMPTTTITPDRLIAPGAVDILKPYLDEIVLGQKTAQEAFDEAQAEIENLVEENK